MHFYFLKHLVLSKHELRTSHRSLRDDQYTEVEFVDQGSTGSQHEDEEYADENFTSTNNVRENFVDTLDVRFQC